MPRKLLERTNSGRFKGQIVTEIQDYLEEMTKELFSRFPDVDVNDILTLAGTTMRFQASLEILRDSAEEDQNETN